MQHAEICRTLTEKINLLKDKHEMLSSLLPDVRLLYGTQPGPRTPVMYLPGIVFLFSGHKIGYINERTFRYDTNEYLLLTVPLPFECETFATPEVPLAGMRLNVDILQLQELLMDIGEDPLFQPAVASSGINSAVLSEDILCAAERLLDVMGGRWTHGSRQANRPRNSVLCADGALRRRAVGAGQPADPLQPDKSRAQAYRKPVHRKPQRRSAGGGSEYECVSVSP